MQGQGAEQQRVAVAIDFTFIARAELPPALDLPVCAKCVRACDAGGRRRADPSRGACRAAGQLGTGCAAGRFACRPAKPHAWAVRNLHALPTRREVFIDQRDAGLRVTWHPEQDLVVLSVWHDDRCVGRLPDAGPGRSPSELVADRSPWRLGHPCRRHPTASTPRGHQPVDHQAPQAQPRRAAPRRGCGSCNASASTPRSRPVDPPTQ